MTKISKRARSPWESAFFISVLVGVVVVGGVGCATPQSGARYQSSHVSNHRRGFLDYSGEPVDTHLSAKDFKWPLQAPHVTSTFGKRGREFHEGVDLRAETGTAVLAARSGLVIYSGSGIRGYGKMVVIRHPGGVSTVYAHNSKILVYRGQKVQQGQKIALSGNTGHSTGPHVHFEIRRGLAAVNPVLYLPQVPRTQHLLAKSRRPKLYASLRSPSRRRTGPVPPARLVAISH